MKLWMAYTAFGFSIVCILALAVAGCGQTPTGPTVEIKDNSAPVTANITTGSSSNIGTAPCGATSSQKNGQNTPGAPNCSTTITNPPASSEQTPT